MFYMRHHVCVCVCVRPIYVHIYMYIGRMHTHTHTHTPSYTHTHTHTCAVFREPAKRDRTDNERRYLATFSKSHYIVALYSKINRSLTFENFGHRYHERQAHESPEKTKVSALVYLLNKYTQYTSLCRVLLRICAIAGWSYFLAWEEGEGGLGASPPSPRTERWAPPCPPPTPQRGGTEGGLEVGQDIKRTEREREMEMGG